MIKINDLIKEGESETVEFKPSLSQTDKIMGSISAFSNTKGGTVVIGVTDKGEVHGVDIGKRTIENLANGIKQNIDPMVYPSIRVEKIDDKLVVLIEIEESKQKPVLASGRAYKRVGKSNHKLGYEEIRNIALETSKVYWDERVCEDASLEDIEEDKLRWYLERREEIRKVKKPEKMDIDTLLLNIGAAKKVNSETKPTNFEPADTRVAIFDDRIEIISPGTFPEGVTPEEPKHVPVNPILCQLMYDVGFIEKYGSGIYMTNDLSDLVEKGLVKRVGRGRGSYYVPNI